MSQRRSPSNSAARSESRSASPKRKTRNEEGTLNEVVNSNQGNTLYVGNLPKEIDKQTLEDLFRGIGKIVDMDVPKDPGTGLGRKYAFVTMETNDQAEAAVAKLNNKEVSGRPIQVARSKRSKGYTPTPGRYLGKNQSNGTFQRREGGYRDRERRSRSRDYERKGRGGGGNRRTSGSKSRSRSPAYNSKRNRSRSPRGGYDDDRRRDSRKDRNERSDRGDRGDRGDRNERGDRGNYRRDNRDRENTRDTRDYRDRDNRENTRGEKQFSRGGRNDRDRSPPKKAKYSRSNSRERQDRDRRPARRDKY